jgi:hypothetical protein
MKIFVALSILLGISLGGCATSSRSIPLQDAIWQDFKMKIPASWVIESEPGNFAAKNPDGSESMDIMAVELPNDLLSRNPTPEEIIKYHIAYLSQPGLAPPEVFVVEPIQTIRLPCGEPASLTVEGLGEPDYSIDLAVASKNSLYTINFYQWGNPEKNMNFYRGLIKTARITGFPGSRCTK